MGNRGNRVWTIALLILTVLCGSTAVAAELAQPRHIRLYLAGPLGFSEAGTQFKDSSLVPALRSLGYDVTDPWTLTAQEKIDAVTRLPYGSERRDAWKALDAEIARNNEAGIDHADAVLAVLDGTDVDSGTAAEIGYAYARGKPVLGYRGDFRLSADNEGSTVNLQVEYFIRQRGGEIITSLRDLPRALSSFGSIARLAARVPPETPAIEPLPEQESGAWSSRPDAIKDVVRFFESAFTIVLALALGEAFKQFVADGPTHTSETNILAASAIRWDRLWALFVLLLFLLPFFQGMNRYFYVTYSSENGLPAPYSLSLMVDSFFFVLEAALFFVMSRALSLDHWRRFYTSVLLLLVADSTWGLIAICWHSAPVRSWLILNLVSLVAVMLLLINFRHHSRLPLLITFVAVFFALARTSLDYDLMWRFYFP